ncbi:uncharacterized protein LOC130898707 [Diorhabda carinulata]|uniref:uncharacterized protein LOC130898707 n=1 Tax=Diorhabda carinulata TaxID=1163345 RepID=UPI0025A1703D|nr:uncharacterized protein LOC130898707 [Diorhabda carinulata]XP_057664158.1 uncharacterized protein LOC130898707 [Diorhabda carinulata]
MKRLLLLSVIIGCYIGTDAEKCRRPNLSRNFVYIYSTTGKVPVKIGRCLFNNTKDTYSDISDNCRKAFQTGVFIDKWSESNKISDKGSPIELEEYVSRADLIKNEVDLRSGSECRYDRGFCYDPTETNSYAVVWEIFDRSKVQCPEQLYKVFEGDVDIWDFQPQGLKYLFYYDNFADAAFSLGLQSQGNCQDTDVWYTEEGYVVSKTPLKAKNMDGFASLKTKTGIKGVKGGIKGGVKGGRITIMPPNRLYFSLKSKKIVSENIMRNCDILSLTLEQVIDEINSEYLDDSQNLHFLLKRYYDLIQKTKEDILEIIKKESTLYLSLEMKQKLSELSQKFEKTLIDITDIKNTLESAGNLKGIRADIDNLHLEINKLLKKNGEYDDLIKRLSTSIEEHSKAFDDKDSELQKLSVKLEELQTFINNQLSTMITKNEVYDKLHELEQGFHNKVKELAMNVTLLLLQHEGSGGVKGKGTANAELEQVIIEKLKGFNLDQQQAAIDSLKLKMELLFDQLKSETYNNATLLEEKISKQIDDLAAQKQPILDRLDKVEKNIDELNSLIDNLKLDLDKREKSQDNILKEYENKIIKIWENFDTYDKIISDLKKDLSDLREKEVDFQPVYKKIDDSIEEALKPRDRRLDNFEDITSKLTDSIQRDTSEVISLQQQIDEINKGLKKVDDLKLDITDEFEKEVRPVHSQLFNLTGALEEHSKKQTATHEDLQDAKNSIHSELEYLKRQIQAAGDQLNATIEDNSDSISKLIEQDNILKASIESLEQEVGNQDKFVKNLDTFVKDKTVKYDLMNENLDQLINKLNENVTELYGAIKKHEESILELSKQCEKAALQSSSKVSGTKGGVKSSSVKTTYYQQNSGKTGKVVEYSVDEGSDGSYTQTKTTQFVRDNHNEEIATLRSQLSDVLVELTTQNMRISHLEKTVYELSHKLKATDDALTYSTKALDQKIDITEELVSSCCHKSSYTGVKSSYTGVKSGYTGVKH